MGGWGRVGHGAGVRGNVHIKCGYGCDVNDSRRPRDIVWMGAGLGPWGAGLGFGGWILLGWILFAGAGLFVTSGICWGSAFNGGYDGVCFAGLRSQDDRVNG